MEIEIANSLNNFQASLKDASIKHNLLNEMYLKCKSYEETITYYSYNLILFRKLLAYNYMNSGILSNVSRAKEILDKAIKEFEMGNFYSPEQFSSYFQLKLLLALTYEFYYQHNLAYTKYEKTINEIENKFPFIDDETKNILYRLMYIINPETYFEEKLKDYKGLNLASVYQNKRRIIEKRIKIGTVTDKEIADLSNQFEQIKLSIDKLYHVTHYRLLFQYHLMKKEYEIADVYYKSALRIANEYEFWGQIKRLEDIKKQA